MIPKPQANRPPALALIALSLVGCELFDESFAPDSAPGSCFVGGPMPELAVQARPGPDSAVLEGRFEAGPGGLWFGDHPAAFVTPEGRPFRVELPDLHGRRARVFARLRGERLEIHAARTEP